MAVQPCGGAVALSQAACKIRIMRSNDAWGAVAELAASQHGAFTRSQAAERGLTARRLRTRLLAGEIIEVRPRVLILRSAPPTWRSRLAVATLAGGGAIASHRSAARLHRIDGFTDDVLEVTVPRGRYPSADDVVTHRWRHVERADVTVVDGIRCTTIATTLAQLGAVVPPTAVERALDDALRRGVSSAWITRTLERLHRPGPSGTGVLRRILGDPRRGEALPESWFERLLERIAVSGLPAPRLQHRTGVGPGVGYRLDLAWPEVLLGLEGHSRRYHFGPAKSEADHRRDLELAAAGWEVVYVTWHLAAQPALLTHHLQAIYRTRSRRAA